MSKWCWIITTLLCLALLGGGIWLVLRPPYALGCLPSPTDALVMAQRTSALDTGSLPSSIDMRDSFAPRSQGSQNSCVGFAASALMGQQAGVECAPAFIYNQRTTTNCKRDAGMSIYNALAILSAQGDCTEALMPYDDGDSCTQPNDAALADARKISGYSVLWSEQGTAKLDAIRSYLAAGQPVIVAVPVYQRFYGNAAKTIGPHTDGERYYGGHALLLVGYDSDGFWALNSWGPSWGHDGFACLSDEFIEQEAWEGWVVNGLLGATTYSCYVHGKCVDDATGANLSGVTLKLGTRSSTTNASGDWGQTFTLTPDTLYTLEVTAPTGYWLPGGATFKAPSKAVTTLAVETFRFKWIATATPSLTPKPTATPSKTATFTPEPTFPCPPTEEGEPTVPCCTPTATPKCVSGYQQFSWAERQTIIANGYRYLHGGLEDDVDMMTDSTLAIGNAQRFLAPLTRAYTVTGDQGEKIVCRGFAYAIVCQRTDDPCGGEFGVVDWSGPMMTLASGEWQVAP